MNISSRLHSWKRMTTAVQCLEQCLVSKAFAKGLNNLNKSYCGGCERKLFHVGVSRFPRLSLTWDVSLSSAHCSWQFCQQDDNAMTDQSTWVGGRGFVITVIAGVGEPALSLTTPSQVQLRPEGGEQLRLSGLDSNAAQLHHSRRNRLPTPPSVPPWAGFRQESRTWATWAPRVLICGEGFGARG